jgi:hypothetical protein
MNEETNMVSMGARTISKKEEAEAEAVCKKLEGIDLVIRELKLKIGELRLEQDKINLEYLKKSIKR